MGRSHPTNATTHGTPQVIAHRGYAAENPENTIAAMRAAAADDRTNAVEIDARATRDDRVIVFHDDNLSRLTDAPAAVATTPIRELSYAELSEYAIGDSDESIPLLVDVLAAIPESITVNIELKHPGCADIQLGAIDDSATRKAAGERWEPFVERVLDIVTNTAHEPLISSFYEGALAATQALAPAVSLAPLVTDVATANCLATRYDAAAVHPPLSLLCSAAGDVSADGEQFLQAAHGANRQVNAWTVTTHQAATALAKAGVDGLIVDSPRVVSTSN